MCYGPKRSHYVVLDPGYSLTLPWHWQAFAKAVMGMSAHFRCFVSIAALPRAGWFQWSLKNSPNNDVWSFEAALANGWLPI